MKGLKKKSGGTLHVSMRSPEFRKSAVSFFWSLSAVLLTVALVWFVWQLPASATKLDTSVNGLHSLSADTKAQIRSLDRDVTVILVCTAGAEDALVLDMLDRYADLSDHLLVQTIDPAYYPNFVQQQTGRTRCTNNSLIVSCGSRTFLLNYNDFSSSSTFMGEDYLNNAISFVTNDRMLQIGALSGHGETSVSEALRDALALEGFELQEIYLLSDTDPLADFSLLLLHTPKMDLLPEERAVLSRYMENGGRLLLYSSYAAQGQENLMSVLGEYGLSAQSGYICEESTGFIYSGNPSDIIPSLSTARAAEGILSGISYLRMPYAQGLRIEPVRSSVSLTPLLSSSSRSYAKTDPESSPLAGKEFNDVDGPFYLGAAAEEQRDEMLTRLIWFSSGEMLDTEVDESVGGGNSALFCNAVRWLSGVDIVASLHAKSTATSSLKVFISQTRVWAVVLMGMLPGAVLAVGTIIYLRRRHR